MTLTTQPGSGSSILTPQQVEQLVIQPLIQTAVATRVSTVVQTSSHETRFPIVLSDPNTGWTAEGAEIAASESDLDEVLVVPSKVAGLVPVTNELIADSNDQALDVVGDGLVRDLQVKLDAAYFGVSVPNGPDGLGSLAAPPPAPQVIGPVGTIGNLDVFAQALALSEMEGGVITSFVGNPMDVLALAKLKTAADSNEPLLTADVNVPTQRLVFGVPLIPSPAVAQGTFWAIPKAKVFVVIREDASVVTDPSPYFSSDRTAVRCVLRCGFAFPHQEAIVQIKHGGS